MARDAVHLNAFAVREVALGDGRRVRYRTLGAGPRWLAACHGMALDHRDLAPLVGDLPGWSLLLWDMPGHGESQPPPRDWSLEAMADAFAAVLADAGIARVAILGFSFGGMVAQAFTRRMPHAVEALILYGCFAPYSQPPLLPRPTAAAALAVMTLQGWPRLQADFAERCALSAEGQAAVRAAMQPLGKRGFLAMTRALLGAFRPDPAFALPCPVLLLRGAGDANGAALDVADAALRALRPDATVRQIADAGHCAHLDRQEATRAAIADFLAAL
jgi:3-oxoadipate enol-lactonase